MTQIDARGQVGLVHAPATWEEASALVDAHPLNSAVAGGATYLMWRAAHGEPMPEHLISLHRIAGHDEVADGSVGALATLRRIERGPRTGAQRALTMAASVTAGPAVRSLATLGGNLASGFPQADLVPALLALDAHVHLANGQRLSIHDVVDRGLLTSQLIARVTHDLASEAGWTGATIKLARRGMDLSTGLVSAVLQVDGDEIVQARVAVGSLHDRPSRLPAIESALVGADTSAETMAELVEVIGVKGRRFHDDDESTAEYRGRVAGPLVRRTLTLALALGPSVTPQVGDALA
ncbi:FAD binding domain-containing protein [Terrabacter terrigena]|uniref:FAD binding domain-containing protein n=1 Tax=Terrabacter terrigena TaxID=574718 RepID=A0ABW3MVN7_9MICO